MFRSAQRFFHACGEYIYFQSKLSLGLTVTAAAALYLHIKVNENKTMPVQTHQHINELIETEQPEQSETSKDIT